MTTKRPARVSAKAPRRSSKKTARRRAAPKPPGRAARGASAVAPPPESNAAALRTLRAAYGMSREQFRRLSGFSVRSQATWESGEKAPGDHARLRLAELRRLRDALAAVLRSNAITAWMDSPNPAFEGLKPIELVERGQIDRLWKMIFLMDSGAAA